MEETVKTSVVLAFSDLEKVRRIACQQFDGNFSMALRFIIRQYRVSLAVLPDVCIVTEDSEMP